MYALPIYLDVIEKGNSKRETPAFQTRHMSQKPGFLKQLVDNIKNEMTKNKEMKVCCCTSVCIGIFIWIFIHNKITNRNKHHISRFQLDREV